MDKKRHIVKRCTSGSKPIDSAFKNKSYILDIQLQKAYRVKIAAQVKYIILEIQFLRDNHVISSGI